MSTEGSLPAWAAVAVSVLVLAGSLFSLIGVIGLLRFRTFYERVHAPTLGSSFGVAFISLASIIFFTIQRSALALGAAVVLLLVTLTMPAGLMLLARAALFRDRVEGSPDVPPLE
jgi:multicomponent K+:H+ antiporter subunit G